MKLSASLLIACFLILLGSYAQEGHIYVSNFKVDDAILDSKIESIEFDSDGITYAAGSKGVAVFDGTKWEKLKVVPHNVNKLRYDTLGSKVFVGLREGIGELVKAENGRYDFKSYRKLSGTSIEFNQIMVTQTKVVFYSNKLLYILSKDGSDKIDSILAPEGGEFSGIIKRKESVYVNVAGKGFHKISGTSLKYITTVPDLKTSVVLFSSSFNNKNILFGTNRNKIYLFNGKKFVQFAKHTEIRDFLEENLLWSGIDFSMNYFAVTTLTGGCAIIDKNYGEIVNVINYQTGLPDDEIFSIGRDENNGLWLSHEHGISRCDPGLPLKNFSTYPGISGNINDALMMRNILYAATNEGVFALHKVNYKPISASKPKKKKTYSKSVRKKNKLQTDNENRQSYFQQSITHTYRKVSNLEEKCKRVYPFGQNIIALTNYGVYEISDLTAKPIMTNIYPNDISVSSDTSIVYVAALDGIYELSYSNDKKSKFKTWKRRKVLKDLTSQVYSVVVDKYNNLFLGLDSKAYLCTRDEKKKLIGVEEVPLPEPTDEAINLVNNDGEVYFIQSTGIYVYNNIKKEVFYHDIRSITTKNLQYIAGKKHAWIKENLLWEPVIERQENFPSEILSIFENLRNIYTGKKGELWIIAGADKLLKVPTKGKTNLDYEFKLGIKYLQDNTDSLYALDKAVIPYTNNAIRLSLVAPFYLRPEEVQYQFMIEGLKNYESWSEWSSGSVIELNSIKPGKYNLKLRAKNIINQITEEEELSIKILKPFWQTKSFLIISIVMFLGMIALAFYITNRRLLRKKRILEEKVRERTVQLQEEKDKTEKLLLNILPKVTAEELKKNNKVVPRNYDNATILFTDFKGFTQIAEKLTPEELVNEIDLCFKEFDAIIDKYRIEKIKTIGDAYMCAAGLPTRYKNNPFEMVKAALEIRDYMENYKHERIEKGVPFFEIRIGVHTGKVVAGVVGTKKYAYDIWGDAVNLASRMESSGEIGKVNISGDTHKIIKEKFTCTHRGKVEAKNKGQVDMYFVEGIKDKPKSKKKKNLSE